MLFHVSEEPDIGRFEPRPAVDGGDPVVWAIDSDHLRNYLLPRDCPRVTFYAGEKTTQLDAQGFLGTSAAVVAVEQTWFERLQSCRLYVYHLPSDSFECLDSCAGYFVSRTAVMPASVEICDDPVAELTRRGVELRVVPNLWALRDVVVASSLQFSMIRMRNAQPRTHAR